MENNSKELNSTQEEMIKGIQATVKIARWVYEAAIDEGFSQAHAFAMSLGYFTGVIQAAQGKPK